MRKTIAFCLLGIGTSVAAMAGVPEINAASSGSALALLAGALLMYRGRRKK